MLARNQLDLAPMMRMKPWMLANVLALFEAAQAGYVPALSVEAYLLRVAKTDSKPILEFEGIEQQFELFEKAPWATQISFLEEALKAVESRSARRELNRIVQAWETADRVSLERLLAEMSAQSSVGSRFTVDTILLGRHPQMVRKIETMMAEGSRTCSQSVRCTWLDRKGWSSCYVRAATRSLSGDSPRCESLIARACGENT